MSTMLIAGNSEQCSIMKPLLVGARAVVVPVSPSAGLTKYIDVIKSAVSPRVAAVFTGTFPDHDKKVVREVRANKNGRCFPVLAVTSVHSNPTQSELIEMGADEVIQLPDTRSREWVTFATLKLRSRFSGFASLKGSFGEEHMLQTLLTHLRLLDEQLLWVGRLTRDMLRCSLNAKLHHTRAVTLSSDPGREPWVPLGWAKRATGRYEGPRANEVTMESAETIKALRDLEELTATITNGIPMTRTCISMSEELIECFQKRKFTVEKESDPQRTGETGEQTGIFSLKVLRARKIQFTYRERLTSFSLTPRAAALLDTLARSNGSPIGVGELCRVLGLSDRRDLISAFCHLRKEMCGRFPGAQAAFKKVHNGGYFFDEHLFAACIHPASSPDVLTTIPLLSYSFVPRELTDKRKQGEMELRLPFGSVLLTPKECTVVRTLLERYGEIVPGHMLGATRGGYPPSLGTVRNKFKRYLPPGGLIIETFTLEGYRLISRIGDNPT